MRVSCADPWGTQHFINQIQSILFQFWQEIFSHLKLVSAMCSAGVLKIFKFVYFFGLPPLFSPVSHCFSGWSKKNHKIYYVINCLNENLVTHFVWCLEKGISFDIETLSIDRELNKEHLYGKIIQKMCTKS